MLTPHASTEIYPKWIAHYRIFRCKSSISNFASTLNGVFNSNSMCLYGCKNWPHQFSNYLSRKLLNFLKRRPKYFKIHKKPLCKSIDKVFSNQIWSKHKFLRVLTALKHDCLPGLFRKLFVLSFLASFIFMDMISEKLSDTHSCIVFT